MTAGLWFSVVNLTLKHVNRMFQTFSPKANTLQELKLYLQNNRNEPKQSVNTAWQITEVSNSSKREVNILKTEQQMYE